jgi:hypothetical protein
MRVPPFSLPQSGDIDVAKLARAFDDTTQCYKFLFFRALLERFKKTGERTVALTDILAGMIESAWWPVMHYRLTIGVGQGVHHMRELVDSQTQDADERPGLLDVRAHANRLAVATIDREISRGVLRYVPTRFLSPWLDGVIDKNTNASIASISPEEAIAADLPYRFVDRRTVELGAGWASYFRANMPIVKAWADLHWLDWMQARNPNVGVGLEKLGPPPDRQSVALQTAFLKAALNADAEPKCIFTGAPLDPNRIAIDHFMPRAYIGHDRIWNLVPITPEINSRKGARLPHLEAVDRLAAFHSEAIGIAQRDHIPNWARFREEYASDLRIDLADLHRPSQLAEAYRSTVGPMLAIAKRMGFPPDWPRTN